MSTLNNTPEYINSIPVYHILHTCYAKRAHGPTIHPCEKNKHYHTVPPSCYEITMMHVATAVPGSCLVLLRNAVMQNTCRPTGKRNMQPTGPGKTRSRCMAPATQGYPSHLYIESVQKKMHPFSTLHSPEPLKNPHNAHFIAVWVEGFLQKIHTAHFGRRTRSSYE